MTHQTIVWTIRFWNPDQRQQQKNDWYACGGQMMANSVELLTRCANIEWMMVNTPGKLKERRNKSIDRTLHLMITRRVW